MTTQATWLRKLIGLSLIILGLSLGSYSAMAAGAETGGYVGGLFGLSIPDMDHSSARPIYGLEGGAKLGTEFGLAGYYFNSAKSESLPGGTGDFNYSLYGVQFTYHFEGEAKGVYFGGRLGLSKVTYLNASISPYHWGMVAGYDKFLGDTFSIGVEGSYMNVAGATDSSVGRAVSSFGSINFLAALKIWF
jgi:hypothetical protein